MVTANKATLQHMKTAVAAMLLAASLAGVAAPVLAQADPPAPDPPGPSQADCDQNHSDPACRAFGHWVTCGFAKFPIFCWKRNASPPEDPSPPPPSGAPPSTEAS